MRLGAPPKPDDPSFTLWLAKFANEVNRDKDAIEALQSPASYVEALQNTLQALTTSTPLTLVSLPLTVGDWEVTGEAQFAGTATGTFTLLGLSNVSAAFNTTWNPYGYFQAPVVANASSNIRAQCSHRVLLTAPTRVYLVCQSIFTAGAMSVNGKIRAREWS